ncbi:MAG: hypothetical protein WC536_03640 [Patescibacteria group bacterium]
MSSEIKRQIQQQKVGKVAKTVMEGFLEGVYFAMETLGRLNVNRYSIYGSLRKGAFSDWSDTQLSIKIKDAVRTGYLKIDSNNSIEFTDKAKLRIVDVVTSNNLKDGKNRFISFDIPEEKRSQRDGFRRTIKKMGFRQIQKSLWVCDRNIGDFIEIAKKEYDVEKYVAYIVSEKSDIDDHIKTIMSMR